MKVTQKKLENGLIRLNVVASKADVKRALDNAHFAVAYQMNVKPVKGMSLEQAAKEQQGINDLDLISKAQAVDYLIPFAIDMQDILPSVSPKAQYSTPIQRDKEFAFTLDVKPKPVYELESYEPVEISVVKLTVDEADIDGFIENLAQSNTEYKKAASHRVEKGDSCLLALETRENGNILPGLTVDSRVYTTGAGLMPPSFDDEIIGMDVGETKSFSFAGPSVDERGNEVSIEMTCTATVKEIMEESMPVIDDAWVKNYMPACKDMDGLREYAKKEILAERSEQYENYKRQMTAIELGKRFKGKISDEAYEEMSKNLMNDLKEQLKNADISFEDYVAQQGGEQQFNMKMMIQARQMLSQGYALTALFHHENMELTEADYMDACRTIDPKKPEEVRKHMKNTGRTFALKETAQLLKANKWLLSHATVNEVEA